MTWEEKFAAICALKDADLKMRQPGDWYVSQGTEVKERIGSGVLVSRFGNGESPIEAIKNHWILLTEEQPLAYIVLNATNNTTRRHVRWNGYMWSDIPMEKAS